MKFSRYKKYKYNQHAPYVGIDVLGENFKICEGDEIEVESDGELFRTSDGHCFALPTDKMEWFTRIFSEEERNYYIALHHQAAIAAMQGLLSDHTTLEVCVKAEGIAGIDAQTFAARFAVSYANALIKELKSCGYD